MGFVLGPVLRRLAPGERRAVISCRVPRTLLYFPIVAATTATAGWYLSSRLGLLRDLDRDGVVAALVLTGAFAVQGLLVILPNNLRIWRELQGTAPDTGRINGLNRQNMRLAGVQGVLQVAIILIMAYQVVG